MLHDTESDKALLASLETLAAVYQSSPIGMCVLDRELRYVHINDHLARINGQSVAAHIGRTVREVIPLVADTVEAIAADIFRTGEPRLITQGPGVDTTNPERSGVWQAAWRPIKRPDGFVIGLNVVVEDITARRNAEDELRRSLASLERRVAERTAALAESEQEYRALAENTRDIPFRLDREGILRYVGPQIKAYGLDPDQMIGSHFLVYIHADDRERAVTRFHESLLEDVNRPLELRLETPARGTCWFEERDLVQKDAQGQAIGMTGILRDITENRKTAEALWESEEKYRKLFETEANCIFLMDAATQQILDVNDSALRTYGYTREEFLSLSVGQVSAEAEASHDVIARAKEDGSAGARRRWHRRKDGSIFPVDVRVTRYTWKGREVLYGIGRDISDELAREQERQRAADALRESEEKYRRLFELETDGILFIDMESKAVVDANEAALRLYGYSHDEFMSVDVRTITAEPEATEALASNLREHGYAHAPVRWHRRKDGKRFPVEVHAVLFTLRARAVTILVVRDIAEELAQKESDHRQREALARLAGEVSAAADRERQRIAAILHDNLAQLLVGCQLRIDQVLGAPLLPPTLQPALQRVWDILNQAVKDTRHLTFQLAPPALEEIGLAAALEQLCQRMSDECGIPFTFRESGPPPRLGADLRQTLFRCARELVINAGRHAGGHRVAVAMENTPDGLRIMVEDDGRGFDTRQAGFDFSDRGGFGLFSARQQLLNAGASLTIHSTPGLGTSVVIEAPWPPPGEVA